MRDGAGAVYLPGEGGGNMIGQKACSHCLPHGGIVSTKSDTPLPAGQSPLPSPGHWRPNL